MENMKEQLNLLCVEALNVYGLSDDEKERTTKDFVEGMTRKSEMLKKSILSYINSSEGEVSFNILLDQFRDYEYFLEREIKNNR